MRTKYIVVKHPKHGLPVFIMFPEYITHKDFYQEYDVHGEIVSAGFVVMVDHGELICHGESIGLDVKSRPEDSALANDMFRRD